MTFSQSLQSTNSRPVTLSSSHPTGQYGSLMSSSSSMASPELKQNKFAVAFRRPKRSYDDVQTSTVVYFELPKMDDTYAESLYAAVMTCQAKQKASRRHPFNTAYGRTDRLETAVAVRASSHAGRSSLAMAYGPLAKRLLKRG